MNTQPFFPNKPITGLVTHFNDLSLTCPTCGKSFHDLIAYGLPLPPEADYPNRRVFAIRLQPSSQVCACLAASLEHNPLVALSADSSLNN